MITKNTPKYANLNKEDIGITYINRNQGDKRAQGTIVGLKWSRTNIYACMI